MCRGLLHTSAVDLSSRLAGRVSPSSSSATTPPREKPGGSAVVRPISSSLSPASARMARCLPPMSLPLPFQGPRGLTVTRHVWRTVRVGAPPHVQQAEACGARTRVERVGAASRHRVIERRLSVSLRLSSQGREARVAWVHGLHECWQAAAQFQEKLAFFQRWRRLHALDFVSQASNSDFPLTELGRFILLLDDRGSNASRFGADGTCRDLHGASRLFWTASRRAGRLRAQTSCRCASRASCAHERPVPRRAYSSRSRAA